MKPENTVKPNFVEDNDESSFLMPIFVTRTNLRSILKIKRSEKLRLPDQLNSTSQENSQALCPGDI